ncbi:MAG: energy transducer TonB [Steroidobacteraceae bacterium]
MSTSAIAHVRPSLASELASIARVKQTPRKLRKAVINTAQLPWDNVALHNETAASIALGQIKRPPGYVWLLAGAALLLHLGVAWYVSTHSAERIVKPKPAEVALEFERPKPPEPKIEPPKPQPKPQQVQKAQVLPPIQTAAPEPSDAPAAPSPEPPVAVAPIVTAPPVEAPPLPVTAPIGRAGYLNNPPPNYPAAALRQGWQGTVILRVHVQANGKPDTVEVQKSSGRKVLDDEAVRTVKNYWSYTPAKRGDTPVDGWTTTPIEFQIAE